MGERIYPGSPAQEFYDLCKLYLKHYGEPGTDSTRVARIGRLMLSELPCGGGWLSVEYLRPCATNYELVWRNDTGFNTEDWYQHLEVLRRKLILERLSDV